MSIDNLRKQPEICDATTGYRSLRNERRNSGPMTCHYLDLPLFLVGRASLANQKQHQDLGSDA